MYYSVSKHNNVYLHTINSHCVSGKFRQYDYGLFGNLKKYGSLTPPKYDLSAVTAPVYLLYSNNDWLSHQTDVLKLYSELGNVQGKFLISDDNFNHLDYMFAIDAPKLVYNKIISLMTRHWCLGLLANVVFYVHIINKDTYILHVCSINVVLYIFTG